VIINGKYATSATMAGSYKNMIDVIKKLAEKENVAKLK